MLTVYEQGLLVAWEHIAEAAGHIFPAAAACEAALESGWGTSECYRLANNVFGEKQTVHAVYPSITLPTIEIIRGERVRMQAEWIKFPSLEESFRYRMATLLRLADTYPHYRDALSAKDEIEYLIAVSFSWSTDPQRAAKCMEIYNAHKSLFAVPVAKPVIATPKVEA